MKSAFVKCYRLQCCPEVAEAGATRDGLSENSPSSELQKGAVRIDRSKLCKGVANIKLKGYGCKGLMLSPRP